MRLEQWKAAAQATTRAPRLAAQEPQTGDKGSRGRRRKRPVGVAKGCERRVGGWSCGAATERVNRPMIKTEYFSVLFCTYELEKRAFPQVAKKLASANPQKSGSFLSWGRRMPLSPAPNMAYCMASPTIRMSCTYHPDSLEKVRFVVINSLEKVRFPR